MPSLLQARNSIYNTAVPAACYCFGFHKLYPAISILNTRNQVTSRAFFLEAPLAPTFVNVTAIEKIVNTCDTSTSRRLGNAD